jgi:hypothetical protein
MPTSDPGLELLDLPERIRRAGTTSNVKFEDSEEDWQSFLTDAQVKHVAQEKLNKIKNRLSTRLSKCSRK